MADYGRVAALDIAAVNETTARGRVAALDITAINETTARGRVAALDLTAVNETTARGRVAALDMTVIWSWGTPLPVVPDILVYPTILATFDSSASVGSGGTGASIAVRLWSWTSVPGGSAVANITPTPMPNNGGAGFVSMASNKVLYHCEGDALDSSGNVNNAALTNVTTGAVGKVGSFAWSYNATTAVATITPVPLTATHTVAFWFYNLGPTGSYKAADRNSTNNGTSIIVWQTTNELGVWLGAGLIGTGVIMNPANYTGWHHIAAVSSGGSTLFYIDGLYVGTAAGVDTGSLKYVGNSTPANPERFADRIDEYAIWTRALSAVEIRTLWLNQVGGYAGEGTTFDFTPDVAGTYTIQYSQTDSYVAGTWTTTANGTSPLGFPFWQGDVGQGIVDSDGNPVPQGESLYHQGATTQGANRRTW